MFSRIREWLEKRNKAENRLAPTARAALVREAFTAMATVAFLKWMDNSREELKSTTLSVAELWEACFKEVEMYWPGFQATSASSTDDRLYGELERYRQMAAAMGLEEWRMEAGHNKDGQIRDQEEAMRRSRIAGVKCEARIEAGIES